MKSPDTSAADRRRRLFAQIEAEMADVGRLCGLQALDQRVLDAMAAVPREEFVPAAEEPLAYANIPLPIGYGQTISQPFMVAVMTDLLQAKPHHVVLEIGTGSGYQAAVLARLVKQVYSIEIVAGLEEPARARLARLGFTNIAVRHGDGHAGWPEHAPFDGIIVTAAAPSIPRPLIEQLGTGGRMVIPVDDGFDGQDLVLLEKSASGEITSRKMFPVAFVPLTGGDDQ